MKQVENIRERDSLDRERERIRSKSALYRGSTGSRKKKQIIKYSLPVSVCVCVFVRLFREPVLVGRSGFNEEEEKVLVSMLLS